MKCPKCTYVRRASDTAPDWQCPRCGVAYAKVGSAAPVRSRVDPREEERSRSNWLVIVPLLLLGLAGWWGYAKWRASTQAAEAAQAASRIARIDTASAQLAVEDDLKKAETHLRMGRPREGLEILERRAAQGHPRAMLALGVAYKGYGHAPVDLPKAIDWLQRAAREGNRTAYVHLGYASHTGRGLPQSYDEAVNQYRKAARGGDESALYVLGMVHAKGVPGIPADPLAAHLLLDLAAREYAKSAESDAWGVADFAAHHAQHELRRLAPTLSAADVARAKQLADAWSPGQPLPQP